MKDTTITILRGCGMGKREIELADLPRIHHIPQVEGFGLIGPTGIGKTIALARLLANWVEGSGKTLMPYNFALWVNWPDEAESLKSLSVSAGGQTLWDRLDRIESTGVLFLDDLGRERMRGDDDFALGQIRSIIDHRYRNNLPVYWTSNLSVPDLTKLYGDRMVGRMIEAWPPVQLTGKNLRLERPNA